MQSRPVRGNMARRYDNEGRTVVMLQHSVLLKPREVYVVCALQLLVVVYRAPYDAVPFTIHTIHYHQPSWEHVCMCVYGTSEGIISLLHDGVADDGAHVEISRRLREGDESA